MCDPLGVHVLQTAEDLLDEERRLRLAESLLLGDKLKQLSSADPANTKRTQRVTSPLYSMY